MAQCGMTTFGLDPIGQAWPEPVAERRVVVLGSTGSIGTQALEVAGWAGHRVVGLAAGRRADLLVEQARRWRPAWPHCGSGRGSCARTTSGRSSTRPQPIYTFLLAAAGGRAGGRGFFGGDFAYQFKEAILGVVNADQLLHIHGG